MIPSSCPPTFILPRPRSHPVLEHLSARGNTIELVAAEKKVTLRSVAAGHDLTSGLIPAPYKVRDDELHDLLKNHMSDLSLNVRSTSPYAALAKNTLQVDSAVTLLRKGVERVLPRGMSL